MKVQKIIMTLFLVTCIGLVAPLTQAEGPLSAGNSAISSQSVTLETTSPYSRKAVRYVASNNPAEFWVSTSNPTRIQPITQTGSTFGSAYNYQEGYYSPYYFDTFTNWSNNPIRNPWSAYQFMRIENTTTITTPYSVDMKLEIQSLGVLEVDELISFTGYNGMMDLQLAVRDPGVYFLYYGNDISFNSYYLVGPDQRMIVSPELIEDTLPEVVDGEEVIKNYIAFVALSTGTYHFYFTSSERFITLEFQGFTDTTDIDADSMFIYDDLPKGGINPDTLNAPVEFDVQLYSIEVSGGDYLLLNFATVYGAPTIFAAIPNGANYDLQTISGTGTDSYLFMPYDGTMLIVVINNEYFQWNAGVPVVRYLNYRIFYSQLGVEPLNFNTTQEIEIPIVQGAKLLRFSVSTPTVVYFNYTVVSGSVTFRLQSNSNTTFFYVDPIEGVQYSLVVQDGLGTSRRAYVFEPGTYYATLLGSTTGLVRNIIKITSQSASAIGSGYKAFSKSDTSLNKANGVELTYPNIAQVVSAQSEYYPNLASFTANQWLNARYNISLWRDDNPEIFSQPISNNYKIFVRNSSSVYVDETYDPNPVNMFVNGTANVQYVYIGSTYRFDQIRFNLAAGATDYSLRLMYRRGSDSTWQPLNTTAGYEDSTRIGNKTLAQSGTIAFDPNVLSTWNPVTDPDGGAAGTVPNQPVAMFWVRIQSSSANLPQIPVLASYGSSNPQIQLYRYVRLYFSLRANLGLLSKFDGHNLDLRKKNTHTGLNIIGHTPSTSVVSASPDVIWPGESQGRLLVWPYNVYQQFYNTSTTATSAPIQLPMKLRVCMTDETNRYQYASFSGSIGSPPVMQETAVNWTTYNTYNIEGNYNATEYDGVFLHVNTPVEADWYQFISANGSRFTTALSIEAYFDTPWTTNKLSRQNGPYSLVAVQLRDYAEMGIPLRSLTLKISGVTSNASVHVYYLLNIARFSIPLLKGTISNPSLPKEFPVWVIPTAIGGGAVLVAGVIVAVVIYKKRHPI